MAINAIEACGGTWISDCLTHLIHNEPGSEYVDPRDDMTPREFLP